MTVLTLLHFSFLHKHSRRTVSPEYAKLDLYAKLNQYAKSHLYAKPNLYAKFNLLAIKLYLTDPALANCKRKRGTIFLALSSQTPPLLLFPLFSFPFFSFSLSVPLVSLLFFAFRPLAPSPGFPSFLFHLFLTAFVLLLLSFRCFCSPFSYLFTLLFFHTFPSFPSVLLSRFTKG